MDTLPYPFPTRFACRTTMPRRTLTLLLLCLTSPVLAEDLLYEMQSGAVTTNRCQAVHWGFANDCYSSWTTHANRLVPVYTFGTKGATSGIDLKSYTGPNSVYRDARALRRLYGGSEVTHSVNPDAEYMDQTNVFDLQQAALQAGRKYIFVVVFDGMDWQTTRAASIWNLQRVAYTEGRGEGTHFQEYQAAGTTQYGWMVTSPFADGAQIDVNTQRVLRPSALTGGYSAKIAGSYPWSECLEPQYLVGAPSERLLVQHAYTDSAASATSMFCGIKTYNDAVGIDPQGRARPSIAHQAQAQGYKIGLVTSVPISHATPASAYAHNVHRDDYQDITRDLLGLPSISHPKTPLPGVDVLLGCGCGWTNGNDIAQGDNLVAGNRYLTAADRRAVDVSHGGKYVLAQRTEGKPAGQVLQQAVQQAQDSHARLLGLFGVSEVSKYNGGHLPYATADGDYHPAPGIDRAQLKYTPEDLAENPTLADLTAAALQVLPAEDQPFWLMVEAGDVDWANHANNLDASIGAVNSGDAAVKTITDWVEQHSNWQESLLIVTADHGHFLMIDQPEMLIQTGDAPVQAEPAKEVEPVGAP